MSVLPSASSPASPPPARPTWATTSARSAPRSQASRRAGTENFYFLADYHALIKCDEPARIQRSTLEIAACWLAAGLDPEQVFFYRQSDIPEIPELTWLLTCVTGKGLLNRAHAYKAAVDKNVAAGSDPDADVTAGLFMYPVLMAADILMFKAHKIPVGRDQVQHIEMARDMAQSFNHLYGEHFVLPEAAIDESVAMLPGLDGRKMSKSYDNIIPLFAPPRADAQADRRHRDRLARARASPRRSKARPCSRSTRPSPPPRRRRQLRQAYADGIAWGDAKQLLFERIDREIAPDARALRRPGQQSRRSSRRSCGPAPTRRAPCATPFMARAAPRRGPAQPGARQAAAGEERKAAKAALPSFKQYREADGRHYFKLVDAQGRLLAAEHRLRLAPGGGPHHRAAQAGRRWPGCEAIPAAWPRASARLSWRPRWSALAEAQ